MNKKIRAVRQGRQIFWLILPLILVVPAVNLWQTWFLQPPPWLQQNGLSELHAIGVIGSVFVLLLWGLSYRGSRAARISMALLYLFAGTIALIISLWLTTTGSVSTLLAWIAAGISVIYGMMGLVLLVAPQVRAFQRYRRQRRATRRHNS